MEKITLDWAKAELVKWAREDLALRDALIAEGRLGEGYDVAMEALHVKNADRLERVISQLGFPTESRVEPEAAEAAWLIVQHAISRPNFMRACRDVLKAEPAANLRERVRLAYLEDRIAIFENRPQTYGTQFDYDANGELSPQPIADADGVDERRAALGLDSLAERTKKMRDRAQRASDYPRVGHAERKLQYEKWKRRVGWLK
ncbi:DUF6624 domain-containing protein [Lewinella sp. 4G2]|uniref:DUF6624 domain-containing protein n=1 Tax=Lewinella sp. 4G2 TaxID=1803372 RepID=UPI0007B4ED1F|nr:DUF6624 domain-containing protein [Lewinella sp. 4G2]OAV45199.1 hypothetical protein A3850_012155 [Lewinella sp. 4G2]